LTVTPLILFPASQFLLGNFASFPSNPDLITSLSVSVPSRSRLSLHSDPFDSPFIFSLLPHICLSSSLPLIHVSSSFSPDPLFFISYCTCRRCIGSCISEAVVGWRVCVSAWWCCLTMFWRFSATWIFRMRPGGGIIRIYFKVLIYLLPSCMNLTYLHMYAILCTSIVWRWGGGGSEVGNI
jgi:hypothetical protein